MLPVYKMLITSSVAAEVSSGLWLTSILPTCSQLRGKDNCSSSDDKVVGERETDPCLLLRSASETLCGRDKNTMSCSSARCPHPELGWP